MLSALQTVCGVGMPNQKCSVRGQGVHLQLCAWSAGGWYSKCYVHNTQGLLHNTHGVLHHTHEVLHNTRW